MTFAFLFIINFVRGQTNYHFKNITVEDKLISQNLNYYLFKDSYGYIWISTIGGINRFDGKEITQFLSNKKQKNALWDGYILSQFVEDNNTNIWFSTIDGLNYYDRLNNDFIRVPLIQKGEAVDGAYYLMNVNKKNKDIWFRIDYDFYIFPNSNSKEFIYIGNYHSNILSQLIFDEKTQLTYLFTPLTKGLEIRTFKEYYEINKPDTILNDFKVKSTLFLDASQIYLGTDKGLVKYDYKAKSLESGFKNRDKSISSISDITLFDEKTIIVGTANQGLYLFDLDTKKYLSQIHDSNREEKKAFLQPIDKLYVDRDKGLWVSTNGKGIYYASLKGRKINHFFDDFSDTSIKDSFIRAITEDKGGNIYNLTPNGIHIIVEEKEANESMEKENYLSTKSDYPYSINFDDKGRLWACDISGLRVKSKTENRFEKVRFEESQNTPIGFFFLEQLSDKNILASSSKGIFQWNESSESLQKITNVESEAFSWITQNPQSTQVLFRKIQNSFLIGHFQQDTFQLDTTINFKPFINYLHHDTLANRYWLATSEGLHWIDYEGDQYKLQEDTVLRHKTLMGVLREDDSNNLWLSSNRGIIKYNFKTGEQRVYGLVDGVQSLEFNFFASYKSKSGKLMFGGVNGLNIFDPKTIIDNAKPANPTITSILINDEPPKEKLVCSETANQNISYIEHLEFSHNENTLSFNFAALGYVNPDANQFRYRMKGQEDKWVFSDTKNFARYANLSTGNHVFEVDATNSDGVWSERPAQLHITIHPPWYLTWYAYVAYFITGISFLYGGYKFQIDQRLKQAEAHRLKELDRIKTALYTNITHEFRTPLTIILGMANQIKDKPQKGFQQGLEMIRRSGQNLLNLVNQMLDLSKVESGNMQPQYIQGDIIQFLEYLVESFQSFAASKNINVTFYNEVPTLMMDYDTDKLQTIVTNLLSNATKFTPEKGTIIVHIQQIKKEKVGGGNWCQLKIKDNGIGIDEKDLPHIFDRFYQIDDSSTRHSGGTGIGLALTKELVELMEGSITVQSQLNKGTEFTIVLPVRQTAAFAKPFSKDNLVEKLAIPVEETILLEEEIIDDATLPLVLIIEDNLDVITYLQACLEEQYRVSIALDGQAGIEKAIEIIPDIIITDVMMPLKDGYEVCEVLKAAAETSHIPIIMLTAKAQIEAKIEGLSKGADAYLSKPFHQKELEVRLAQLLKQRKKLQAFYSQQLIAPSQKIEDPFIQKVIDLVESDLSRTLSVDQYSKSLGMSRTQVFRKIKAITGFSTSNFIQRIRLKNGHHLLLTTQLNVAEIAYAVGFKDPAYFSRSFLKVYQTSPTQLREGRENAQKK